MIGKPSPDDLRRIAEAIGFEISDVEMSVFVDSVEHSLESYQTIDRLTSGSGGSPPERDRGRAVTGPENPYGAWAWKASIKERAAGPLDGKRIVLKDTVSVAGLPLRNGSPIMEGYTSTEDATVVSRILSAGGEIVGKAVSEGFCFSGGSHTSHPAPVSNPLDPAYMTGGSSSGNAALLLTGECDIAIGGDQGGSVRIPCAWCGLVGLKPTWGLVPYSGAFPIEPSIDHLGPMARSVGDVAAMLEVIAGRDGLDPRQIDAPFELPSYSEALRRPCQGLRIGVLKEGFGIAGISDPQVDALVLEAAERFAELGMVASEVSVPMHAVGAHIWNVVAIEGAWSVMVRDNLISFGSQGAYDADLIGFYAAARRGKAKLFPATVKPLLLLGYHLGETTGGTYYAKAQNLRRGLRAAYDEAFSKVDLLVMPTVPRTASLMEPNADLARYLDLAFNMIDNTAPFNATGHPALTLPCGKVRDMPVGLMMVGRRFDESTVLTAAKAYEDAYADPGRGRVATLRSV